MGVEKNIICFMMRGDKVHLTKIYVVVLNELFKKRRTVKML